MGSLAIASCGKNARVASAEKEMVAALAREGGITASGGGALSPSA